MGRFIPKNRNDETTTQPTDNTTTTDHTRASSCLSGNYDLVTDTSQISTPFSTSPTNSPLPLTLPLPQPQNPTEVEEMASETILPFHGDKEDENPEDFLRAFYRRMGDKTDEVRKAQFRHYLQADSAADEWYAELPENEKKSWNDIEAAFGKRWPMKKQVKKTEDEYEDEIVERKLKLEDLGKKEKVAGREVYTHIAWADKMATSVKEAKWEKTTNQLRQVRKNLLNVLRSKNWDAFLTAVRDVDIEDIRDAMDIKSKEQEALDQRLRTLETLSRSPTAPLRQQLSTIAITSQPSVPNLPVNGDPFANNGGG